MEKKITEKEITDCNREYIQLLIKMFKNHSFPYIPYDKLVTAEVNFRLNNELTLGCSDKEVKD